MHASPPRSVACLALLLAIVVGTASGIGCASEPELREGFSQGARGIVATAAADERSPGPQPFVEDLGYAPGQAKRLDLVQDSELSLNDAELAVLAVQGLVISRARTWSTFTLGYEDIYRADLPVFISADSLLHALRSSYDEILVDIELGVLIPELDAMLREMRSDLREGTLEGLPAQVVGDVDLTLAVALSLLSGGPAVLVASDDSGQLAELVGAATAGEGIWEGVLFGYPRILDASQFAPRGHYTRSRELTQYFRAMMWLGRIDFRPIETTPLGEQVLLRRQLEDAIGLTALLRGPTMDRWRRHDETVRMFVGESDNMTPLDVSRFLEKLGVSGLADLAAVDDARLAQTLVEGDFGRQLIASHLRVTEGVRQIPLPASFRLLGQRFILDSFVFSNLVYDRMLLPGDEEDQRFMPSPLDVAYAVFGNERAKELLADELARYPYEEHLQHERDGVDALEGDAWQSNLYTLWLGALRSLSPTREEVEDPSGAGLPRLAATAAWSTRLLNTQLASWAELRHDTLLYAKQSFSASIACAYPDFYVEPNPAFFAALEAYALLGRDQLAGLEREGVALPPRLLPYFEQLAEVTHTLGQMAARQRRGEPHTAEELAFVNGMVRDQRSAGCGSPVEVETPGWYQKLFYAPYKALEWEPTIADVHTDGQNLKILHVATGDPRMMVLTLDTCEGPCAYVGLVSSYYEVVPAAFERLNDEDWMQLLQQGSVLDVAWMRALFE